GWFLAGDLRVSPALGAAVGGVIVAWLAFRTYRLWLLLATVAVVVSVVLAAQMDQAGLNQMLQSGLDQTKDLPKLIAVNEQGGVLSPDWRQQLTPLWERSRDYFAGLGIRGSMLPIVAAILAIVIAIRAARGLAAIWLSLLGAILTAAAVVTAVVAQWPSARANILENSQWVFAGTAALWMLGLL